MKTKQEIYDVLIVGCGAAGCYGALQFSPDVQVLMLSKYDRTTSNSNLAQGGVAAVLSFDDDSYELHINDTMIAGHHANNIETVEALVHEGPDDVRRLLQETDEVTSLLLKNGSPRFSRVEEGRAIVGRAVKGGVLSMAELLEVAAVLRNFRELIRWYAITEHDALAVEYEKLEEDAENPAHIIRRIMEAVAFTDAKTVTVTIHKDGQDFTFKTEASVLRRDCTNTYGTWYIVAADRREFERRFGRSAEYAPGEIVRITYARKVLYEAQN